FRFLLDPLLDRFLFFFLVEDLEDFVGAERFRLLARDQVVGREDRLVVLVLVLQLVVDVLVEPVDGFLFVAGRVGRFHRYDTVVASTLLPVDDGGVGVGLGPVDERLTRLLRLDAELLLRCRLARALRRGGRCLLGLLRGACRGRSLLCRGGLRCRAGLPCRSRLLRRRCLPGGAGGTSGCRLPPGRLCAARPSPRRGLRGCPEGALLLPSRRLRL